MARRRTNPRRRRRTSATMLAHNPRRVATHNPRRRRRHNPRKVTVINPRRRRRNPEIRGLVKKSAIAAVGAMASNALSKFVPDQYKQGWTGVGVKLGVAYALGWAAERFVAREVAEMLAVGGAAAAAGDAINMLLGLAGFQLPQVSVSYQSALPAATPKAAIAPQAQTQPAPVMGDIVEVVGPFTEYGDQGFGDIIAY